MIEIILRSKIEAEEAVKSSFLWTMLLGIEPKVPFPMHGCAVAALLECLWKKSFWSRDGFGLVRFDHSWLQTIANVISASHKSCSRRCAWRLNDKIRGKMRIKVPDCNNGRCAKHFSQDNQYLAIRHQGSHIPSHHNQGHQSSQKLYAVSCWSFRVQNIL